MAINRTYTQPKAGLPLKLHTYVDDAAAGGQIVLTAEMVKKLEIPTKSGLVEAFGNEWIIVTIKNRDAEKVDWISKPTIRGLNEFDIDSPVFDDGYVLPSAATIGSFGTTIEAGDEQAIKIDPSLVGWGFIIQADAPAQNLDLAIYVLSKKG